MGVSVDWTIHFGDVLALFGIIGAVLFFAYRAGGLSTSIEMMQENVSRLEKAIDTIAALLTKVAVQDERIDALDRRLEDVRKDFIEALERFHRAHAAE